ncbi:hypothetical protein D3C73_1427200 [compost metagenome]
MRTGPFGEYFRIVVADMQHFLIVFVNMAVSRIVQPFPVEIVPVFAKLPLGHIRGIHAGLSYFFTIIDNRLALGRNLQ